MGVQCYELFGGIALKTHTFFSFFFHVANHRLMSISLLIIEEHNLLYYYASY